LQDGNFAHAGMDVFQECETPLQGYSDYRGIANDKRFKLMGETIL
jgi:hypothetical protein